MITLRESTTRTATRCSRFGEGSPIPFYKRYGFERTGEIVYDDEVLLRLNPASAGHAA